MTDSQESRTEFYAWIDRAIKSNSCTSCSSSSTKGAEA
jgi:hypothetical protein